MVQKYTPDTHPVVVISLDGTIWKDNYPFIAIPFQNAVETINSMITTGYEIVIVSERDGLNLQECKRMLIDKFELNANVKFNQHSNFYSNLENGSQIKGSVYLNSKAINSPNYETDWLLIKDLFLGNE